jgi:hypothetical protein
MGRLQTIFLMIILLPMLAAADYVSNNFLVTEKSLDFDKTIRSGKCSGSVPYPQLFNDDEELSIRVNEKIKDFAEIYAICNQGERSNFSVSFDVPHADTKDFFSVRWLTKKDEKLWRIDTINFNAETGDALLPDDIFNMLSDNMMSKMVELSAGHLADGTTWEDFLRKIESRDVQFYIKDREWYIVFNASASSEDLVDVKIPEYFLIGGGDNDRG